MTEPKTFLGLVAKNYISWWTEDPLHEVVEELSTKNEIYFQQALWLTWPW
jgi:hypothetical protein